MLFSGASSGLQFGRDHSSLCEFIFPSTILLLLFACGLWIFWRKPAPSRQEPKCQPSGSEPSEALPSSEAEIYWSRGYGRYKYLGLHANPFIISKPADYSLGPLDLALPEMSLDHKNCLAALSSRVVDLARAGSIRVDPSSLIRYLRAREWDVVQAEALLRQAAEYREKHDINRIFTHWNLDAYEHCLAPWWLSGGFVGHGRNQEPIALERIGRCDFAKLVSILPFDDLLKLDMVNSQRMIAALEEDALRRNTPFMQVLVIMDLQGFGFSQIQLKAARSLSKLIESRILTMTEVTKKVLAVNAPPAAARAWSLMKNLLDPGTAAKVEVVTTQNTYRTLLNHIDEEVIPAYLGGLKHVNGDPECRAILAPGGLPPPAALARFSQLIHDGGQALARTRIAVPEQQSRWRSCCGLRCCLEGFARARA